MSRPKLILRDFFWLQGMMGGHKPLFDCIQAFSETDLTEDLKRFEWAVLDWNQPSIDFYKAKGARIMGDWQHCRVDGEALLRLGTV